MTQSDIRYERFINCEDFEGVPSDLSVILRKHEMDPEFYSDTYSRQLVPCKSDNDTDSSCQDNVIRNNQALYDLDFNDDKSSDFFAPTHNTRLFGQLHRLGENFNFHVTEKSCCMLEIESDAGYHKMIPANETTCCRMETEQTSLKELVPILHCRKPLPLLYFEKSPAYVNAKQYDRILKLRNKKLADGRIKGPNFVFERPKSKTFRHESRSLHAKNRKREGNGRFTTKKEATIEHQFQEIPQDKSHLCPKIKKRQT